MMRMTAGLGRSAVVRTDDDDPASHVQHVHFGAVQVAQTCAREHLLGRADRPAPTDEIQHPIDVRQDRVDLVCHEHDRGPGVAPARVDQLADRLLVREVEREQRLVAQQHPRIADQRLRDPQPLLLASRQQPEGRRCVTLRADRPDRGVDARTGRGGGEREAAPVAVEPEPHEIAAADRQVRGRRRAAAARSRRRDSRAVESARRSRPRRSTTASSPSRIRSNVVLPDPFGPSTARNSPGSRSRSRCSNNVRSPKRIAASLQPHDGHRQPPSAREERLELVLLPGLVTRLGLRHRLGDGNDGDPRAEGEIPHVLRHRTGRLRVVDQHTDPVPADEVVHRLRISGARFVAVLDRPREPGRSHDVQAGGIEEVPGNALGVGNRRVPVLGA